MQGLIALLAGASLSALVIRAMIAIAPRVGLVDLPGEHKQHEHVTPFVGGFGVLAALLVAVALLILEYPDRLVAWLSLLVCGVVMFGVGLADDRWKLSARIRLVIQAGLALLMVYGGGVVLADVGDAFFVGALTMGFAAAVPFTVFGTVGCINALNMVDGIDGLSGTIAAGTLALIALVAGLGGDGATFLLALCLLGGVLGFLWFNLRFGDQLRARVFMGDNGSMTLGLLLCWLLITITQGPNALVPPIVALWIFALPLVDTLSVMFRRMWMGKSPFSPDRNHLHHLLQRAGFRVENTVGIMGTLHFALGATGIAGAWLGVPEGVLAIGWLVVFLAYFRLTARPWRFVPMLRGFHRAFGLTPARNLGVFMGNCTLEHVEQINALVAPQLDENTVFRTRLYQRNGTAGPAGARYAVVQIIIDDEVAPLRHQDLYMRLIRRAARPLKSIYVRSYVHRDPHNERRASPRDVAHDRRSTERRIADCVLVEESFTYVRNGRIVDQQINHPKTRTSNASAAPI
ncbi:hypothetical protein MASR2M50_04670 [Thauera sp.]